MSDIRATQELLPTISIPTLMYLVLTHLSNSETRILKELGYRSVHVLIGYELVSV